MTRTVIATQKKLFSAKRWGDAKKHNRALSLPAKCPGGKPIALTSAHYPLGLTGFLRLPGNIIRRYPSALFNRACDTSAWRWSSFDWPELRSLCFISGIASKKFKGSIKTRQSINTKAVCSVGIRTNSQANVTMKLKCWAKPIPDFPSLIQRHSILDA